MLPKWCSYRGMWKNGGKGTKENGWENARKNKGKFEKMTGSGQGKDGGEKKRETKGECWKMAGREQG